MQSGGEGTDHRMLKPHGLSMLVFAAFSMWPPTLLRGRPP